MLQARGVVIRYGPRAAVAGVDLDVADQEVLGLLGPNGAGKTTLLRRLAGLLPGQAGTVVWHSDSRSDGRGDSGSPGAGPAGDPARSGAVRARIGYLPEDPPLYPDEVAVRYVAYLAALAGVPRRGRRAAAEAALERVGAADLAGRLCGRLSKGQRQRVALAGAVVHRPAVLLLDEPSEGLDPRQIVGFRSLLADLRATTAVVLSTHLLAEAQAVCDRVVVLDGGRLVLDQRIGEGPARLRVVVAGADPLALRVAMADTAGVRTVEITAGAEGTAVLLGVDAPDVAEVVAATVLGRGWRLRALGPAPDDLEAAFLAAVSGTAGLAETALPAGAA